jgi:chromosome segregation ATPase
MLALGTGMIVLMVTAGVGIGLVGGWYGFRWRHKGRVFSESDREFFQNLLYRSETAETKLETMEPELGRTRDRANILEDSHRIIQEELANERQFNLSLNADFSHERAHRKFLEGKLRDQAEALEAAQRRIDGELADLAKRIGENTQALAESLEVTRDAGEPAFAAATF